MQLTSILLALVATATAIPLTQDLPTIVGAINGVSSALTTLDTAVKALTPTSDAKAATADLNSKSDAVLTALKDGAAKITATTPLSLTEAIGLVSAASALATSTNTTVSDLIAKKAIFDASGQSATVLKQFQDQLGAAKNLITALVGKLPSAVASVGNAQGKAATDAIAVSLSCPRLVFWVRVLM